MEQTFITSLLIQFLFNNFLRAELYVTFSSDLVFVRTLSVSALTSKLLPEVCGGWEQRKPASFHCPFAT